MRGLIVSLIVLVGSYGFAAESSCVSDFDVKLKTTKGTCLKKITATEQRSCFDSAFEALIKEADANLENKNKLIAIQEGSKRMIEDGNPNHYYAIAIDQLLKNGTPVSTISALCENNPVWAWQLNCTVYAAWHLANNRQADELNDCKARYDFGRDIYQCQLEIIKDFTWVLEDTNL